MDGNRIFTWDKSRFPDPARMLSDLRQEGFRVINIVDPYVKVEAHYPVYDQGLAGSYFVKKPDGNLFTAKGWPGKSVFPDFTMQRARDLVGLALQGCDG